MYALLNLNTQAFGCWTPPGQALHCPLLLAACDRSLRKHLALHLCKGAGAQNLVCPIVFLDKLDAAGIHHANPPVILGGQAGKQRIRRWWGTLTRVASLHMRVADVSILLWPANVVGAVDTCGATHVLSSTFCVQVNQTSLMHAIQCSQFTAGRGIALFAS